jgi:GrpB-like predicted nucleotidyltransferase (UPF0157 family)
MLSCTAIRNERTPRPFPKNFYHTQCLLPGNGRPTNMSHHVSQELQIVSYDPRWIQQFEAEREHLLQALGALALRIDHNGSTAVPGLDAKPIIDIQISVDHLQPIEAYAERLASLGYFHTPHPDDAVCPFFHRPLEWPHTHHVHVVQFGGEEERRTLAFRDFLGEHDDVVREYATLKKQLAATIDAGDAAAREAYANSKTQFIQRVVQIAISAGYPRRP